jgi:hypothetical protein
MIPIGLLILLIFVGLVAILILISNYLSRGKFDPAESSRQHIKQLLTSRELQSEQLILSELACDEDSYRKTFFCRELAEVFDVEPGYLRYDDSIHQLTSVCMNDLGVFSGEDVFYDGHFKYDTVDVFIFEIHDLLEKYIDVERLSKDPAVSQQFPDSEEKLIKLIRSMTVGRFIEFMCRTVDPKKVYRNDKFYR